MKLIVPVVNMNGDKRDVLLAELTNVREKLEPGLFDKCVKMFLVNSHHGLASARRRV